MRSIEESSPAGVKGENGSNLLILLTKFIGGKRVSVKISAGCDRKRMWFIFAFLFPDFQ